MASVLFLCVENACRSQMAEGFFNSLAPGEWQAISAGSQPAPRVHPLTVEVMRESGIDISPQKPKPITEDLLKDAELVVLMGCGEVCPLTEGARVEQWDIEDPSGYGIEALRRVRDAICERVKDLTTRLKSGHGSMQRGNCRFILRP